jgi:hypothetical protein
VKGDINRACATALARLSKYVGGDNQRSVTLAAERPLLLQKVSGLWQFSVRLSAVNDIRVAPEPRAKKVRIIAQGPALRAVTTWRGRLTEQSALRAETAIIGAIARGRHWFACGPAMVRIYAAGSLLPFVGGFEIALPVSTQGSLNDGYIHNTECSPSNRRMDQPSLPVS